MNKHLRYPRGDGCRRLIQRIGAEEQGANLIIVALTLMVLLGFSGIAVDGSNAYYQQQRMQIAADAAALAGARQLALGATDEEAGAEILALAQANGADSVTWEFINDGHGVTVVAMNTFDTYFARLYGYSTFDVNADSEAQYEPVANTDGLFPMTVSCDCVEGGETTFINDDVTDVDDGGGDEGGPSTEPITGTIELEDDSEGSYEITFTGRTGNVWNYQVTELSGRDLSHWSLGIGSCLDQIVTFSPGGAEIGTDASTAFNGVKWNTSEGFSTGVFSFELADDYPVGNVLALAKAGTSFGTVEIPGPICDGSSGGSGGGSEAAICLPTLDFETDTAGASLAAGQIIDSEWSALGVTVRTYNGPNHPAMIFNTASPTGGDVDLGSSNQDFGGPGQGAGGRNGMPGKNNSALGKVLIVAEANNPANPDDAANGGTLAFQFAVPVRIDEVQILDIDNAAGAGMVKAYSAASGGTLLANSPMLGLGDNSFQIVPVNAVGVGRLEISLPAGGAVPSIVSCRTTTPARYRIGNQVWNDTDIDGIQDPSELGIGGVRMELYLSGQNNIVASAITNGGGEYSFAGLPAGSYEVKVADSNFASGGPLANALFGPRDATADATDSDFSSASKRAPATIPLNGGDNLTVDAGLNVPPSAVPGPKSGTVRLSTKTESRYLIEFKERSGNTWTYKVSEEAGADLSHWDLGIVDCLGNVISSTPGDAEIGTDASTGFTGIKWNTPDSFSSGYFSFTLDGNYAPGTRRALAKARTISAEVDIIAPDCTQPDDGGDDGGGDGGGDENACVFEWLDWDGPVSSNLELKLNMEQTRQSGAWGIGDEIPHGPPSSNSLLVMDALDARFGDRLIIPLTNGSGDTVVCGFAQVRLTDYEFGDSPHSITLEFLDDVVRSLTTDPLGIDYGARDVRILQ